MAKIVVFGTRDIAKLAHYYFTRDSHHEVVAFTVDRDYRDTDRFLDLPVINFDEITQHFPPDTHRMFIALSYTQMNHLRAEKYFRARELGYTLESYVSSKCNFLSDSPVGDNCFILEDNTIQPFVRIGNNVTLWSGNHIGHDAVIGDHCFISSHVVVSGHTLIGERCFLGVNSTIRDHIIIAPGTMIGAGATITEDTLENGVYVPARSKLLSRKSGSFHL